MLPHRVLTFDWPTSAYARGVSTPGQVDLLKLLILCLAFTPEYGSVFRNQHHPTIQLRGSVSKIVLSRSTLNLLIDGKSGK